MFFYLKTYVCILLFIFILKRVARLIFSYCQDIFLRGRLGAFFLFLFFVTIQL